MSSLASAVLELRTKTGDSQQSFATKLGMSRQTIAKYEDGRKLTDKALAQLMQLAEFRGLEDLAKRFQDALSKKTTRKTFKYRIYPTSPQIEFLNGELREAASLYNACLEERIGAWKICRKSIDFYDQAYQLKPMRADGCLTMANFSSSTDVLHRVDRTFKAFFARCKRGEKPGFPRFRSFRRYDSITFPSYGNGCRLLDTGKLRIQGAGHIKVKLHRPVEGTIKTVTIKREAGRWFVCFSVEYEANPLPVSREEVGIDVGLTSFATLSDRTEINNPRYYRNAQARLRICQRKVSRRPTKTSNRRRKAVQLLQRAHARVVNQRADFAHKESRKIVNRFGFIGVEDLNVKGLAAGMLAKSVHDAAWSMFLNFITYKAEDAGREVVRVDARGTSQECICGARVPKTLRDRWHNCTDCGLSAPRDYVSALLILFRARNAGLKSGTGALLPVCLQASTSVS